MKILVLLIPVKIYCLKPLIEQLENNDDTIVNSNLENDKMNTLIENNDNTIVNSNLENDKMNTLIENNDNTIVNSKNDKMNTLIENNDDTIVNSNLENDKMNTLIENRIANDTTNLKDSELENNKANSLLSNEIDDSLKNKLNDSVKDKLNDSGKDKLNDFVKDKLNIENRHKVYKEFAINSESSICSNVGKNILERGGNAMDSAIAVALCIGTVNAFSSGIGGGGFFLIRQIIDGKDDVRMLDFRESAPSGIKIEELVKEKSLEGGMSVATPGEVLGFYEGHKLYGKIPWKELFEENIKIAKSFRAEKILVRKLRKNRKFIFSDSGLKKVYTRKGRLLREGDIVERPNYAETLRIISEDPLSFYTGALSHKIVAAIKARGGIMTEDDLRNYTVLEGDILKTRFYDYDVYTTGLPSSGALVVEALNLLEHVDFNTLARMPKNKKLIKLYKILIIVMKAISERRGILGDPQFIKDAEKKLKTFVTDSSFHRAVRDLKSSISTIKNFPVEPFAEDHGTTHLEVVDSFGMIVQITSSINLEFGAKMMDPETGIVFNNQINDFYIPNVKNAYNLPKMPANIIERLKRPISSAAPLLLIGLNRIVAIGATGGSRIPSAIIGTIAYWKSGMSFLEAVSATRIHNQLSPNITYVEKSFPKDIKKKLAQSGEIIKVSQLNTIFTSVQVVEIVKNANNVIIHAISDYRKDGNSSGK